MLRRTQLPAPTLPPPGDPPCPKPREPGPQSLLPVPRRSHQAFGRVSRHMSARPRLAAAPSEATIPGSPLRLSLPQWRCLGDSANYIVHQCHLLPASAAANWARRRLPACSRNSPVPQCRLHAEGTESSSAEAALSSSAQAVTAKASWVIPPVRSPAAGASASSMREGIPHSPQRSRDHTWIATATPGLAGRRQPGVGPALEVQGHQAAGWDMWCTRKAKKRLHPGEERVKGGILLLPTVNHWKAERKWTRSHPGEAAGEGQNARTQIVTREVKVRCEEKLIPRQGIQMLEQGSREDVGFLLLRAFQIWQKHGTEQSDIAEPVRSRCWNELTSRCPLQPWKWHTGVPVYHLAVFQVHTWFSAAKT